jgi:hypothetical protein
VCDGVSHAQLQAHRPAGQHLPLAAIRERLSGQVEVVRNMATSPRAPAKRTVRSTSGAMCSLPSRDKHSPQVNRRQSAMEYINKLRGVEDSEVLTLSHAIESVVQPKSVGLMSEPPSRRTTERSVWERYQITQNIELNVRRPLTRLENRQLKTLLNQATAIFNTGKS